MRKEYNSLSAFYRDFADESCGRITIDDADILIAKLKSERSAEIIEFPNGGVVVVQLPMPMSAKYLPQKKHGKSHYTKLSAAVRKEDAARFSDACRRLGLRQADVLMPVIREIISRAEKEG
jgi:hypothetical protein